MAEITAAAAIEWVVSPVIEMVINKIGTFIEKYFEEDSIKDDMEKMTKTLAEILSTMTIVEKHRIVDPNQLLLVRQIKDAVYNAIDCMDEFDYELAKKENEKLLPKKKNKLVRRVAASCSHVIHLQACSHVIHQPIVGNSSLNKKLREVNKSLDQAKASAKTLHGLMNADTLPERRKNKFLKGPVPSEDIFIPRKTEGESIIQKTEGEWIIRKTEGESIIKCIEEKKAGPPTIIPIVGQGGIGKTTLAQMIFHDPRINDHFVSKLWLSVSDNFDMLELAKQMLKSLCENFSTEGANFGTLQAKLQTELASKKILLILDDVWFVKDDNEKYSYEQDWKNFFAPLTNSNAGSTIIVTTRQELVVNTLKSLGLTSPKYLNDLNDDDGWSLLKLRVLFGKNLALLKYDDENLAANLDELEPQDKEIVEKLKGLKPIGKKIVEMLNGLPLAINVVGSMLIDKFDIEEWKRILKDYSLDNGIIEVLHRSYEHLPANLQRCFAYCSLFPKDYYLKRDRLVHMWIANGFVLPKTGKRLEDIGKSYFSELIARSFIQVIKRNNKEYYVLHDLMNDLACHVSQGECYMLKKGDTLEGLGSVRHLSITSRKQPHDLVNIPGLDKLRTLILLPSCDVEDHVADGVFIKMKKIRVLDIECYLNKFPNIGECKLLRYLCFHKCLELEPNIFSKLHLLTVLFIRKASPFLRFHFGRETYSDLPQSICSMSRLKLIDTSKSIIMKLGGHGQLDHFRRVGSTIFNVEKKDGWELGHLRVLHSVWRGGPVIFNVEKKDGWKLGHLGDFNNIKGSLEIYGLENVASREEAIEARLGSKEHVTELRLNWNPSVVKSNIEHNEILKDLKPYSNIERLEIINYPGDEFPSWLESNWLSKLTYLKLEGYSSVFKMLPALGQFSQLKELEFSSITSVSSIGDEFYGNGVFPSLEELEIWHMKGLKEWSSPSGDRLFPKLRKVALYFCPDLFSLPKMESFYSLESVRIHCPEIRSLPKLPVSLRHLSIFGLHPDLKQFYVNDIFPSLEELHLGYTELEEWSSLCGVNAFPKLRTLILDNCPNLFSLPEMESFCSLKFVEIMDCPKISSLPKLPVSLQDLNVRNLHPDSKQLYGNDIFPSLEVLSIGNMEGLEEWSSPCGVHSFPKLRDLTLEYCPKIKSLLQLPVSLQSLRVKKVHPDLEEQLGNKNGPEWNKVAAVSQCHCEINRLGTGGGWVVLQEGEKVEGGE